MTARPSLQLLRTLSDEHVLTALVARGRATRAELATATGISRPTVSEAVARLEAAGLVADTGERTTGRGRVGSYYGLGPGAGLALVVDIAPQGVTVEAVDALGAVRAAATTAVSGGPAAAVRHAVRRVAAALAAHAAGASLVTAVVSAADPVDRTTGRLVHLPDAPFLVGDLDPARLLRRVVAGPVVVDNDVNWAARAELRQGVARGQHDVFHLFLDEGLGSAVVSDGEVHRGAGGLAGEVAHLLTVGPGGEAMSFTQVFERLGLRRAGSTAIDVGRVVAGLDEPDLLDPVADAVTGVLAAAVALLDPSCVVLGGAWGASAALHAALLARQGSVPRPVALHRAEVEQAPLVGARLRAVDALLERLVTLVRQG
ncbi:ROK family transcriptional regulator [Dermatophilaceae bacterium Soc4.6]